MSDEIAAKQECGDQSRLGAGLHKIGRLVTKRFIILALVVASGVAFYMFADLESMSSAILSMPAESILALLLLLLTNEILKGLRWAFFLRASGLDIRTIDGVTSYLAAQAATALPGGSVLTARLAQEHGHVRMHQAAAGLVGQGIADIIAIAVIAAIGITLTEQRNIQYLVPASALVLAAGAIAVVRSRKLAQWLTRVLSRWSFTRRFMPKEEDFREHAVVLMRARTLLIGGSFSFSVTLIAAIILMTIVNALTARGLAPGEALYAHSLSTVARIVIPVPGGYGVSDGSLAGLLNFIGIGLGRATFVALAYRSVGLLFRTFFGLFMLVARYPYLIVGPLRIPRGKPATIARRPLRFPRSRSTSPATPARSTPDGDAADSGSPATQGVQPAATTTAEPPTGKDGEPHISSAQPHSKAPSTSSTSFRG